MTHQIQHHIQEMHQNLSNINHVLSGLKQCEHTNAQNLQKLHQICSQMDQNLHQISNLPGHTMTATGSRNFGTMGTQQFSSQRPYYGQQSTMPQYNQQSAPQYAQMHNTSWGQSNTGQEAGNYLYESQQLQGTGDQYGRVEKHRLGQQQGSQQLGMGMQFGSQSQGFSQPSNTQQQASQQLQGTGDQYGRVEQHRHSQQMGSQYNQPF